MTTVECIKLKDIKENDLLYIVITKDGKKEAINVGLKTWDRINTLLNPKPIELPLNDKKNEKAKIQPTK